MSKWMKPKRKITRDSYGEYEPYTKGKRGRPRSDKPRTEEERLLTELGIWKRSMDDQIRVPGKHKKTLLREALSDGEKTAIMEEAQEVILTNLKPIVTKACEMANDGDIAAMKLILDRAMPTYKQRDQMAASERGGVTINITGTETLKVQENVTIEGEVVE